MAFRPPAIGRCAALRPAGTIGGVWTNGRIGNPSYGRSGVTTPVSGLDAVA